MNRSTFFSLVIFPISLFAEGGLPDKPYIYVIGSTEVQKSADMVNIRFEVVARAPDQAKANQDVQAKAAKIFTLVNAHKIAKNDLIAYGIYSQPQFENEENGLHRGKIIGHTVTRNFEVRLHDVATFPKLVEELINLEGAEISGIETGFSKETELEDQLWDKALANAREKAERTLKQMCMKIDSVFAVSPIPYPQIYTKI